MTRILVDEPALARPAPRLLAPAFGTRFWWSALVPSLLPRSALMQGIVGGDGPGAPTPWIGSDPGWGGRRRRDGHGALAAVAEPAAHRRRPGRGARSRRRDDPVGGHRRRPLLLGLSRAYAFVVLLIDAQLPARLTPAPRHVIAATVAAVTGLCWSRPS